MARPRLSMWWYRPARRSPWHRRRRSWRPAAPRCLARLMPSMPARRGSQAMRLSRLPVWSRWRMQATPSRSTRTIPMDGSSPRTRCSSLADRLRQHGGLLIVDEAFMDASARDESLAAEAGRGNIVALRSFGKFFGLPGLRLSFALTSPKIAAELAAALGPWPVSGAALAIGAKALADKAWIEKTRSALRGGVTQARRGARASWTASGRGHVVVPPGRDCESRRAVPASRQTRASSCAVSTERPAWLRFGLPGSAQGWRRLEAALRASVSDQS